MSIGGNKGQSETGSTTTIDPGLRAFTEQGMDMAESLRRNVPGTPEFYTGDGVADMNAGQTALLSQMGQRSQGSATEGAFNQYLQNQMGQDFSGQGNQAFDAASQMAQGGQQGMNTLAGIAGGQPGLGQMSQYASGSDPAQSALNQTLSGTTNPLVSQMFQQASGDLAEQFQESTMPGINATFGGAGRTGSGAHQGTVGNAAGELADAQAGLAAQMFGGAAESALNRQQQGLSNELQRRQLGANMWEGGQNRALSAAQSMTGAGSSGIGQMGSLYGTNLGNQQGAAGMTGMANQMDWNNLQQGLGAADRFQQQQQAEIDFDRQRFEHEAGRDIADWERQMGALQGTQGAANPLMAAISTTGTEQSRGKGFGK